MTLTQRQLDWLLRGHPFLALVVTLLVMTWNLWPLHSPRHACVATWYYEFYFVTSVLLAGRFSLLLLQRFYDVDAFCNHFGTHAAAWGVILLIVGLSSVAAERKWPLHWAFAYSRSALDDIAEEALENPAKLDRFAGRQAGCYRITNVYVAESAVFMVIDLRHSSYGFARLPRQAEACVNLRGVYVDADSGEDELEASGAQRITGDWFVVFNSYWSVKDGWSCPGRLGPAIACR